MHISTASTVAKWYIFVSQEERVSSPIKSNKEQFQFDTRRTKQQIFWKNNSYVLHHILHPADTKLLNEHIEQN